MSTQINSQQLPVKAPIKSSHRELIIKIHISPTIETSFAMTSTSNIDQIINSCIVKYKLKKQAHLFIKQQISQFIKKYQIRQLEQKYKDNLIEDDGNKVIKNYLTNKQINSNNIKPVQNNKNRNNFQSNPKIISNLPYKRQEIKKISKSQTENNFDNFKIQIKKKNQSGKQNLYRSQTINSNSIECKNNKNNYIQLGKTQMLKRSIKKKQSITKNTQKQINVFLQYDKFKTILGQKKSSRGIQQVSLKDLQKQVNQQVINLKYQKRIKNIQLELNNVFNQLSKLNPSKTNRIDLRYAYFESLPQNVMKTLHQFLMNIKQHELDSLDFTHFKKLIIKYRGDALLRTLE